MAKRSLLKAHLERNELLKNVFKLLIKLLNNGIKVKPYEKDVFEYLLS
jgi:hypothetical protein